MSYRILNHNSKNNVLISCEHASNKIPKKYGFLGVKKKKLVKNSNYYDIGAEDLSRILARKMNAKCIIANYSRLILDLNRATNHRELIRTTSYGMRIIGNENLTKQEKLNRIKKYHLPYHERIEREIRKLKKYHKQIYYILIHSFSHKILGEERKMDIGLLYKYKKDSKFNKKIRNLLKKKTNFDIRFNEPYSAFKTVCYSLNKHGKDKNIRCVEFEINDKHLRTKRNILKMGNLLFDVLEEAIKR